MARSAPQLPSPDIVVPDEPLEGLIRSTQDQVAPPPLFDGKSTLQLPTRMRKAPGWFRTFVASNQREKSRLRNELVHIKGAWPLLMKQREGGTWTLEEKVKLKAMVRSASSVSPYLFIWAIPGSMLLLPFLAWYLDRKHRNQTNKAQP